MARCPLGCGADVKLVRTPGDRILPLETTPQSRIVVRATNGYEAVGVTMDTYTSHLATCPNADPDRS